MTQIEQLQLEQKQLQSKLVCLQQDLKVEIDFDLDDAAVNIEERDKILALVSELGHKLEAVERALQRSEQGTYGTCERCNAAIDPGRLEILPETTLCTTCKILAERGNRFRRGMAASFVMAQ